MVTAHDGAEQQADTQEVESLLRWTIALLMGMAMLVCTGGDRAVWRGVPVVASASSGNTNMQLVIDSFMQAKGVAPGSPGFPWSRVKFVVTQGDFSSTPGDEVVVGGTVLPEDGFLIIYGRDGPVYKPRAKWDGLACIDALRAVQVAAPGSPGGPDDLAVIHSYDEMLGAFFRWQRLLYLRDIQGEMQLLLELVTLDEAYSVAPPYAEKARLDEEVVTLGVLIALDDLFFGDFLEAVLGRNAL
jgi:hypothetical protein